MNMPGEATSHTPAAPSSLPPAGASPGPEQGSAKKAKRGPKSKSQSNETVRYFTGKLHDQNGLPKIETVCEDELAAVLKAHGTGNILFEVRAFRTEPQIVNGTVQIVKSPVALK